MNSARERTTPAERIGQSAPSPAGATTRPAHIEPRGNVSLGRDLGRVFSHVMCGMRRTKIMHAACHTLHGGCALRGTACTLHHVTRRQRKVGEQQQRGYLVAFLSLYIRAVAEIASLPNCSLVLFVTDTHPHTHVVNHPHHNRTKPVPTSKRRSIYLNTLPSAHWSSLPPSTMGLSHDHWSLTNSLSSALVGSSLVNS